MTLRSGHSDADWPAVRVGEAQADIWAALEVQRLTAGMQRQVMKVSRPRRGVVTGYLFKLIRESIPASQERLAEWLHVDRGTVQGWESGRRPLAAITQGQAVALRHQLVRQGADPALIRALSDAVEADCLIGQILAHDPTSDLDNHPLGCSVMGHALTDMVSWAVSGAVPRLVERSGLRRAGRRGPVPTGPALECQERERFFLHLRIIADRTGSVDERILLHRQACYLGSLDRSADQSSWITAPRRLPHFLRPVSWSPRWVDARSVATSLARQGDRQPLRDFIKYAHGDDTSESAGLTYWAHWVGEIDQYQTDDSFMVHPTPTWRGLRLLRHIVDGLHSKHAFVDLNVHTVWALMQARQGLAYDEPETTRSLIDRTERLMDDGEISAQSRRELTAVFYGLRVLGFTAAKGNHHD